MTDRETQLENKKKEALAALNDIRTTEGLETWRIAHLGKSSAVMQAFSDLGKLPAEERPFTPDELFAAREAFVSAAGSLVLPVVEVDGSQIAGGKPGPIASEIRQRYIAQLLAE